MREMRACSAAWLIACCPVCALMQKTQPQRQKVPAQAEEAQEEEGDEMAEMQARLDAVRS